MPNEPTEGQNACCVSLEQAKWKYDGARSAEMEDRLKKSPIFVYENQGGKKYFRRAVVGPVWVTLYTVGLTGIEPASYKVTDYLKVPKGEKVYG